MQWLGQLVRHLLGHTRYHDQANEVNLRVLRAGRLKRRANDAVQRQADEDARALRHSLLIDEYESYHR